MLRPDHTDRLAKLRIPPQMLEAAGIQSVTDAEAREMLGLHSRRGADLVADERSTLSRVDNRP
jgi:hypothetical protein